LIVDVKNLKRKCRGDSFTACSELLIAIQSTRPRRFFWEAQQPMAIDKSMLVEIYGKAAGLVHSLENDLEDHRWSGK
jgi:hypothetical protein